MGADSSPCAPLRGNCSIPSCIQLSLSHTLGPLPPTPPGRFCLFLVCAPWVHFPTFWGTAKLLHPSETQPLLDSTAADSPAPLEQQNEILSSLGSSVPTQERISELSSRWAGWHSLEELREAKKISVTAGPNPISTGTGTGGNQSHSPDLKTKLLQKSLDRGRRGKSQPRPAHAQTPLKSSQHKEKYPTLSPHPPLSPPQWEGGRDFQPPWGSLHFSL